MNIFLVAASLMAVFIAIAFIRVALGPKTPDRVVGLDTANMMVIATMILLAAAYETVILVDVAIVYAALSFVATIYISKYLEAET
ncbi:monovalent cation/H+ antiporter complex subunit F [Methanonatronarchaeum sp. AMET6-2]|uniref:monovalent cation/H+ antiporter complex subunit F n=1 Tax=Methanonatronarchaeum sp. AMET6-2 TaxID=2933293 RepID=UPI0012064033|nr:monovalent cation/H+ antiporter complex subunit F [Methanonatronarchaeum sp. AMET6-2]RZN61158.1 MAG: cation:proton antiporter [Methanonatronarchaeia archaeon]UOY09783.1 monovalent cation/H+ antiporter complex subunit F [Methanonatronarchaeum sp. AMET6-2]